VDVALANVIGATFFAVLVLFGFYAVYRGFQSRE
jgi:Ca2+/Na+ antiporter